VNTSKSKILIADDDDSLRRVLEFQLQEAGFDVLSAENGSRALEIFSEYEIDCVITDWRMPNLNGAELLKRVASINSEIPVIVITAFGDVETAVTALRGGAFDFITKPFNREAIILTINKALKYGAVLSENRRLRRLVHEDSQLENIVGSSEKMQAVFERVERVAKTTVTVLIEGESGTGKELIARAIHFSGPRKAKPFIAVNCAAIPETMIEAELFGYKKGAFTGAASESKGKFEEANHGTLFLDEISAMPLSLQSRLLRVLQEHEITRLGENLPRKVDVRIVSSTNENLTLLIEENRFREDLYYRLAVVPIPLPPLRERVQDVPVLIEHFLQTSAEKHGIKSPKLDRDVYRALYRYRWPGNVRELENTIERMVVLSDGDLISVDELPKSIAQPRTDTTDVLWFDLPEQPIDLEKVESEIIREALRTFNGNQSQAARYLKITRSALIYRMQKYGLE